MKKALNKKGFTLVELMVVVAILGVLVAIAVPTYNNVTEGAERTVCQANMRTYDSAVMQAIMAGDDIQTGDLSSSHVITQKYMKDGAAVTCPSNKTSVYHLEYINSGSWTVSCTNAEVDHNSGSVESTL